MTDDELLRFLDFNAVHSRDPIAAVYFGFSASSIRRLKRDSRHYETMWQTERASRIEAETDNAALASVLGRILDANGEPILATPPSPALNEELSDG